MPAPRIITSVEDLTTRVNSNGTYNSAIVTAAEKGPIDQPVKVSSQTDFLRKFTSDEKISYLAETSMYEAYQYLDQQNGLYVVRCAHIGEEGSSKDESVAKAGCIAFVKASSTEATSTQDGQGGSGLTYYDLKKIAEDDNGSSNIYPFEDDEVCLFYGKDPGAYTNKLGVAIITDQSIVKLEGAFIVRVYKNNVLVETHTCSLDPTLKDGYGNNCYIENVLENSMYIRAMAKEENAKVSCYTASLSVDDINGTTVYLKKYEGASDALITEFNNVSDELEKTNETINNLTQEVDGLQTSLAEKQQNETTLLQQISNKQQEWEEAAEDEKEAIQREIDALQTQLSEVRTVISNLNEQITTKQNELGDAETLASDLEAQKETLQEEINEANKNKELNFQPEVDTVEFNYIDKDEDGRVLVLPDQNALDGNQTEKSEGNVYKVRISESEGIYKYFIYNNNKWKKLELFKSKYCLGELKTLTQNKNSDYLKSGVQYFTYNGDVISTFETPKQSDPIGNRKSTYKPLYLRGGSDGGEITTADRIRALKTLQNINDINIQLIMDGGVEDETYKQAIVDVCDKREKSCHAILSTPLSVERANDPLSKMQEFRNYDLNINNYSAELYTPHQKYYDEFNDRYIYLSPGPYVSSLIMQTATERGWYWAVAGYNRGVVPSLDVATTFEPSIVDEFSDMQVNTIIKDPGAGNIIWDELTLWSQASDLQEAHISRYVNIYLRPRLKEMLKSFLFEFNDEETRSLVTRKIDIFMQNQGRAIYAYRIVCDETNNLDDDVENNRLNSWLYIKPTKLAKEIRQKIILTPYSADLESLEV